MTAAIDKLQQLDDDELDALIELAQARANSAMSKRDFLKAAGVLGTGAVLGGGAASELTGDVQAAASTVDGDGDIGTPSNPEDVYADALAVFDGANNQIGSFDENGISTPSVDTDEVVYNEVTEGTLYITQKIPDPSRPVIAERIYKNSGGASGGITAMDFTNGPTTWGGEVVLIGTEQGVADTFVDKVLTGSDAADTEIIAQTDGGALGSRSYSISGSDLVVTNSNTNTLQLTAMSVSGIY